MNIDSDLERHLAKLRLIKSIAFSVVFTGLHVLGGLRRSGRLP